MEYENKIVAFVDILGFKEHTENLSLHELLKLVDDFSLKNAFKENSFELLIPVCPDTNDMDICITQISDSLIITCKNQETSALNLIHLCYRAAFRLIGRGFLCRGIYYHRRSVSYRKTDFRQGIY